MLPFKLVYSDDYYLPVGEHVFPAEKYRLIHKRLLEAGIAEPGDFVTPKPAADDHDCLTALQLICTLLARGWFPKFKPVGKPETKVSLPIVFGKLLFDSGLSPTVPVASFTPRRPLLDSQGGSTLRAD